MLLLITSVFLFCCYILDSLRAWRNNYVSARASGLPCVLIPVLPISLKLRILGPILFPLLKRLPENWTESWLGHLEVMSQWNDGYDAYKLFVNDSYYLVAPGGLILLTCAPDAIDHIQHQRDAFQRPVEIFKAIGRYGDNLASSEGAQWRRMRRLVSRAFGEQNNREVWQETLFQAPKMIQRWSPNEPIPLNADSMKMSQNVISKAGFGYRMPWDDEDEQGSHVEEKHGGMSYIDASRGLVHNVLLVIGLPQPLLRYSPFSHLRQVYKYDISFRAHLGDTIRRGRDQPGGNDILHSLLRGAEDSNETLSDTDILGNAFLFMVGGHETTATSMQLAIVFLAMNMGAQKQMQADIDRIVGSRKPEAWTYDSDLPQLLEGWVGAVMQEELRLVPPVPAVLKRARSDQIVQFDGVPRSISKDTYIALSQLGAHRNPKYWPHGPPADPSNPWHAKSNLDNDLEEFKPGRWFAGSEDEEPPVSTAASTTANNSSQDTESQASFFHPQRGAYFPFSEGVRACVGRRFAQIEYAAVLAVIFRHYSIELDVREWASDEEVDGMSAEERKSVWQKAAHRTRETIQKDMGLLITMHLQQTTEFPIRLVKRGEERFKGFA